MPVKKPKKRVYKRKMPTKYTSIKDSDKDANKTTHRKLPKQLMPAVFVTRREFIMPDKSVIQITSHSTKYTPLLVHWIIEYIDMCWSTLLARERFLKQIQEVRDETGKLISDPMETQREEMGKERYAPVVLHPNPAHFATWCFLEKKYAITKDTLKNLYDQKVTQEYIVAYDMLRDASESFLIQSAMNNIGTSSLSFLLRNHHDYKDQKEIKKDLNVSAGKVFENLYYMAKNIHEYPELLDEGDNKNNI